MSKIVLTNGKELSPLTITGAKRSVQGQSRDTLTFVFPAEAGLEALDSEFSEENCETIRIVEEENEYIYSGYVIRAELSKSAKEIAPATDSAEAEYEDRITVAMSQRSYVESQLASLTETVDVLVMESLLAE